MSIDSLYRKNVIKKTKTKQVIVSYIFSILSLHFFCNEPKYLNRVIYNIYYQFVKLDTNLLHAVTAISR